MNILFLGKKDDKLRINIGGGKWRRKGWKVMDFASGKYSDLQPDISFDLWQDKPFPFDNNSVSFFYSSHTLEHIPQEYCQHIFDEVYRCLNPEGAVRIIVPDFDAALEHYKTNDKAWFIKCRGDSITARFLDFFASYWRDKITDIDLSLIDYYVANSPRKVQREKTGNHINYWTFDKLKTYLENSGFTKIYKSEPQGSRFKELRGKGRYKGFDETHPEISLFVEAIK